MRNTILLFSLGTFFCVSVKICSAQRSTAILEGVRTTGSPVATSAKRVLHFPGDVSYGFLIVTPMTASGVVNGRATQIAARGEVVIPANCHCLFVALHQLFAKPDFLKTFPPDAFDSLQLSATAIDESEEGEVDKALAFIDHLTGLRELVLDRSDATDAGVMHAAHLPELQRLALYSADVRGDFLKTFGPHKSLNILRMGLNDLKVENLKYLGKMANLKFLSLPKTRLKDNDVALLATCTALEDLDLAANPDLSDECLKYLKGMKKLQSLNFGDTKVTVRGLSTLKGLPLRSVMRSAQPYTQADLAAFHRAFPGTTLALKGKSRPVDAETNAIYGPFH